MGRLIAEKVEVGGQVASRVKGGLEAIAAEHVDFAFEGPRSVLVASGRCTINVVLGSKSFEGDLWRHGTLRGKVRVVVEWREVHAIQVRRVALVRVAAEDVHVMVDETRRGARRARRHVLDGQETFDALLGGPATTI